MKKAIIKAMKRELMAQGFDVKGLDNEDIMQEYELLRSQQLADEMLNKEPEVTVVSTEVTLVQEQTTEVAATEEPEATVLSVEVTIPTQEQLAEAVEILEAEATPAQKAPVIPEVPAQPVSPMIPEAPDNIVQYIFRTFRKTET